MDARKAEYWGGEMRYILVGATSQLGKGYGKGKLEQRIHSEDSIMLN